MATSDAAAAFLKPRPRAAEAPFAVGEAPRTWGDLQADAATLAGALRGVAGEVMVACADRYLGAVALLAAWRAGCVAALPANGRKETIDALCAERGITLILHDADGVTGGMDVRTSLGGRAHPTAELEFSPEQILVCVYTSGSTGKPLPCAKTARQLLGEAAMLVQHFELGPGTRVLATVPPHHIYGLLFGTLVPFMGGGAFVRTTPLHAETIAALARDCQADVLCSVPAHLRGVAALTPGTLPALRHIFSSGAPLDQVTATRVAAVSGRAVTEIFGSTETGGIALRNGTAAPGWQPLPGVRVEAEADGTMIVHSPFVADTRHRAADRIKLLPEGGFEWLAREDGVVKIGGTRVTIAETERLLRAIPGVLDVAVVAVEVGGARGHELWAALAAPGLSEATVRAQLSRQADPIAVPRRFRMVAALPHEAHGKLRRDRLLALFEAPRPTGGSPPAPAAEAAPERHTTAVAIPVDWAFFHGHFDDFPVVAGVVQMNEIILPAVRRLWPELLHLRRITTLKFRSPIGPGETLAMELTRAAASKVSFTLRRAGEAVSSGGLEFGGPAPESGER
jgi:acyl-coenzyme A synthetase/AMP-(fatty) acid ligase